MPTLIGSSAPDQLEESTMTTKSNTIAKILVWAHDPGSTIQAIGILVLVHAVSAWFFHFATDSTVIEAAGAAALLWLGGFWRAQARGSGQGREHSKGNTEKSAE